MSPERQKDVDHEVTKTMFLNNMDFYDDVLDRRFDIRLFERSFKKRKWCPLQVIGFLAFGRVFKDVDVISLLAWWVPNYRAQFWWFVVKNHLINERMTEGTNQKTIITRMELNKMARERGMKNYQNLRKLELAEKLGIKLPEPKGKPRKPRKPRKDQRRPRRARRVEVVNSDGTTTVYPSISEAAQVLGKYAMQIYVMAASGDVRILD